MMPFSFSTTAPAQPLFGSTTTATTTPSLFGFGSATTAPTGGTATSIPLFGSATTAPTGTSIPLFGSATTAPTGTSIPLFGSATTAPTGTSIPLFGSAMTTGTTTTTSIPLFGKPAMTAPLFGSATSQPTTVVPTQTTAAPSLFGSAKTAATSLFGSATTAPTGTAASVPLFGSATTAPIGTTASIPLFGSAMTTGTTTTTTSIPLFGKPAMTTTSIPLFGSAISQPTAVVPTPTTTAPSLFGSTTTAPSLFGSATTTPAPASAGTTASITLFGSTTTTTTVPLFGSATSQSTTVGSTTTPTPPLFGSTTPAVSIPATTGTTVATSMPIQPSSYLPTGTNAKKITFKELEQLLMRLRVDYERQERDFLNEVDDLNAADVLLRRAQDKMLNVGQDVDELEQEKDRFIWELDILAQQQAELEQTVQAMEKQMGLGQQGQTIGQLALKDPVNATPADVQRQNILQLQMNVNAQLKQLDDEVGDLCEQISDLQRVTGIGPSSSAGALSTEDQEQLDQLEQRRTMVDQIRQILRSQLETLVWVDKQSDALLERVQRTTADVVSLR